jgi:hypothetical protein
MLFAQMCEDVTQTAAFLTSAWTESPGRAEALYELANLNLISGNFTRAEAVIRQARSCKWPDKPFWNHRRPFYTWLAKDLERQIMRIKGQPMKADTLEYNLLHSTGRTVISLVHASRGRVEPGTRARAMWQSMARYPERVEHIFGLDEDDQESKVLRRFRSVVVGVGGGCVAAWNAAASVSSGQIIIQLSDDWIPPRNWDVEIERRLDVSKPQVLAVSDNGRPDDLLCMAILTRKRLEQQGYLFHPKFTGVYSDNYFTDCAQRDGVIINAKELVFEHQHPAFGKAEMDDTYARQNSKENYAYGKHVYDTLTKEGK